MITGIYILRFPNTKKVYVGQAIDIIKRFSAHKYTIKSGNASKKLQEAYNIYGMPTLDILIECSIEELNKLEEEAIEIFNSVSNGFNTMDKYGNRMALRGECAPTVTVTNDQVREVFNMLVNNISNRFEYISEVCGISKNIVKDIAVGLSHRWLYDEYPDKYDILISQKGKRNSGENNSTAVYNNSQIEDAFFILITHPTISITKLAELTELTYSSLKALANGNNHRWLLDKYPLEYKYLMSLKGNRVKASGSTIEAKGIKYPSIKSPNGEIFEVTNIAEFARKFSLNAGHLGGVLRGKEIQHKGWYLSTNPYTT